MRIVLDTNVLVSGLLVPFGNCAVLIDYIQAVGETHATVSLHRPLPDEDDNPFMEVALSSGAECLVTGNLRHFPGRCRGGVRVLAPREFLDYFRRHRTSI